MKIVRYAQNAPHMGHLKCPTVEQAILVHFIGLNVSYSSQWKIIGITQTPIPKYIFKY